MKISKGCTIIKSKGQSAVDNVDIICTKKYKELHPREFNYENVTLCDAFFLTTLKGRKVVVETYIGGKVNSRLIKGVKNLELMFGEEKEI